MCRGVLTGDTETEFIIDAEGTKITLPRGASDAALAPFTSTGQNYLYRAIQRNLQSATLRVLLRQSR